MNKARPVLAIVVVLIGTVVAVLTPLGLPTAAASTITRVQSTSASGSGTAGSSVAITASLAQGCTPGDTLVALVTIAQDDSGHVGVVEAVPGGWTRLFEHSPAHSAAYHGWFADSGCAGGPASVTFTISSPGNSATVGSVVVSEFAGLPSTLAVDLDANDGSRTEESTWGPVTGPSPSAAGELTLTALSFSGSSPSSSTPAGWSPAASETNALPTYMYWQIGTSSAPSASFSWSPASIVEVSMLALRAGTSNENIVQENATQFSGAPSASVQLPDGVAMHDALIATVGTSTGDGGPQVTTLAGGAVSWQEVVAQGQSSGTSEIWVGLDSTGTSGPTTITASFKGGEAGELSLAEASGIVGVDTSASNVGTSQSPAGATWAPETNDLLVTALTTNEATLVAHPEPMWSSLSLAGLNYATEWDANATSTVPIPSWMIASSAPSIVTQAAFLASASPSARTDTASSIEATSATITGAVNPNGADTSYRFEYGLTTSYSSLTDSSDTGSASSWVSASADLTDLAPGTTYHYRLVATSSGGTTTGMDASFSTPANPPAATTGATATGATSTGATSSSSPSPVTTGTALLPAQPLLRVVTSKLRLVARHVVVRLSCRAGPCSGSITLERRFIVRVRVGGIRVIHRKAIVVGRAWFHVSGARPRVKIALTRAGRRLLFDAKRHPVRLRLLLERTAAGATSTWVTLS